ncbi:ATP synthase F1 subunit epsilon [Gammaproteobacteria bacterium]|nr:ATP synthase F1 subunit epsilon [Gammaproteobacteria bacterium]
MKLSVVCLTGVLYEGEVKRLRASGVEGYLGIEKGHIPLLTRLKPGSIDIVTLDDKKLLFYVSGGVLEVLPDQVIVLADESQRADQIDQVAAQAQIKAARASLSSKDVNYGLVLNELAKGQAQLQLIRQLKKRQIVR